MPLCVRFSRILNPHFRDAPAYVPAKVTIVAVDSVAILSTVALLVYYRWQNTKRDRSMAGQDHKRDIEFSDLTDIENKVGSSSEPVRFGRTQSLIHVSGCRSFDTSISGGGASIIALLVQEVETVWCTFQASRSGWDLETSRNLHAVAWMVFLPVAEQVLHMLQSRTFSQQCTFLKGETYFCMVCLTCNVNIWAPAGDHFMPVPTTIAATVCRWPTCLLSLLIL